MNFKNSILKEGYYTILPLSLPLEQEPTTLQTSKVGSKRTEYINEWK